MIALRFTSVVFALLLTAATAAAQLSTGSLRGRVTDPSGAAVPGAQVTVRGPAEQTVRTATDGAFAAPNLLPGEYVLVVEVKGFSPEARTVVVARGREGWVDIPLQTAPLTERIQVVPGRLAGTSDYLARIPGSVDVLDRHTLDSANVFTTNEALRKVPGLNVRDEEGLGLRPNIGVRGTDPTRSTRVLLLEDGVPLTYAPYGDNSSYYHPPVDRFESVEVLKGSGQIAYGPMTVGGVINYITPLPPIRPRGRINLAVGNRDYLNGHATFGSTSGKVGYLLDAMRKQSDGARDNVSSTLHDVNGKLVVSASPRQSLTMRANYYGENSNVTYSGLREDEWRINPRGNVFSNDFFYTDRGGASATHQWTPGAALAISTTSYVSSFRRHWWRQSSNSAQRPSDAGDPACGGMANLHTTCGNEGRLRQYYVYGFEPRVHAAYRVSGVGVEADLGLRVHHERQDRLQKNGDTPTARDGRVVEDNERLNTAFSAFMQQRVRLGSVTVTPGIRLEHVLYERSNRLANVSGHTEVTKLIPGVGMAQRLGDRATWFAGVHRGFAPPRTEDIINNATGGVVDLDPELSWNFELGVRSEPWPGVGVDATLFRMDYENQIVAASVAGGIGATLTNGGQTLHQGLETAIRLDSSRAFGTAHNVYVRAALTHLPIARFEGVRFSRIPGFGHVQITGNRLPYAPEHLATVGIGYALADRFDVLIEGVRVGRQFGDDLNTLAGTPDGQRGELPAHLTWNAAVNYRLPILNATVFATVKNLTDRLYIADRARGLLPGAPRLVQAGVKLGF
jgi:Fe(3+) dicitrate transport protein